MGFFKSLFGKEETSEEKQEQKEQYNFEVLTYDGTQALRVGKVDFGIACLNRALDIKEDEDTRRTLASAYLHNDDLESAQEQYEKLCELCPEEPSYPISLAEVLFQLEDYDKMQEACHRALDINNALAMPHYQLAKMAKAQGNHEQAVEEASAAICAKEDYAEAYQLRAEALFALKQVEDAERDVDFLLEHSYDTDEVLQQKALICEAQNKDDDAILYYNKVLKENPFVPSAYIGLSGIYKKLGREEEAKKTMEEAIEQLGVNPEEVKGLGDDEFVSMEEYMKNAYNALNPFGL